MQVLLIEDEDKLARVVERGLIAEGYTVSIARDGESGLHAAVSEQNDLIILDLMLPKISGMEVLKRLRKQDVSVPVLVLSACSTVEDKVTNIQNGADDYLTKPFAFAELNVRVKALLRRGPVPRSSTLRIADLELDRLTQRVQRSSRLIELTAKEYSLLEYLMLNEGRVLSRNMIIEHVWDRSFDGMTNVVDVYIAHLRRKIDGPHPDKLLKTVRGGGYFIEDCGQP